MRKPEEIAQWWWDDGSFVPETGPELVAALAEVFRTAQCEARNEALEEAARVCEERAARLSGVSFIAEFSDAVRIAQERNVAAKEAIAACAAAIRALLQKEPTDDE